MSRRAGGGRRGGVVEGPGRQREVVDGPARRGEVTKDPAPPGERTEGLGRRGDVLEGPSRRGDVLEGPPRQHEGPTDVAHDGENDRADPSTFLRALVAWLNERVAPPGVRIEADTPLFEGGLIDSMRILELIAWTERETGRTIPDRLVLMDNFRTPRRIAEVFVEDAERG